MRLILLALAVAAFCPTPTRANPDLDRRYALSSIGVLRTWDNVDGIFSETIGRAVRSVFANQSRFVIQDLQKLDKALGNSKLSYKQIIEDKDLLLQIAKSARVDTLLRTKVVKEGPQYTFKVEWLLVPNMNVLGSDTFVVSDVRDEKGLEALDEAIQLSIRRSLRNVPYIASITGRDGNALTLNIGENVRLKRGDTIVIATIEDVKLHPLLKTIAEWKLTPTGRAQVEQVEESIAFARIVGEEEGASIMRDQKIVRVIPAAVIEPAVEDDSARGERSTIQTDDVPHLGYAAGGLGLGSFSRDKGDATSSTTGGGMFIGANAEGQLWFNRQFYADLLLALGTTSVSQKDQATGSEMFTGGSTAGAVTEFRLDGGYRYHLTNDFFGPSIGVKLGFHSISYGFSTVIPSSGPAIGRLDPISFHSLYLGLVGDMPIDEVWGALIELNFGIFSGASEGSTSLDGASDGTFGFGVSYKVNPKLAVRGSLRFQLNNGTYADGSNLSQKTFTLAPQILYYF